MGSNIFGSQLRRNSIDEEMPKTEPPNALDRIYIQSAHEACMQSNRIKMKKFDYMIEKEEQSTFEIVDSYSWRLD